jgi:AI-2 transport protein TqsA
VTERLPGLPGALLTLASLVIVIAGLRAAAPIVLPFLFSLFLAILTLPLAEWLQSRRLPPVPAILGAVIVNLLVLAGILTLVAGSFRDFTLAAPRYQARLGEMATAMLAWLRARGVDTTQWVPTDVINPGIVLDLVTTLIANVAALLQNLVLVFLTMIFLLFEATGLPTKLHRALGGTTRTLEWVARVREEVQRYLGIKTLVSLATGLVIGVALAILGVDFPILWGLVAFILNYVPNLGSILAAIPAVLLTLVQHGLGRAVAVTVVYLVVNIVLGNIVEPALMGRRLRLSTLVVFISLVFWGWVWGPVGMLLSVPLTMVVKITLENTVDGRWIAVLLEPPPDTAPGPG